MLHTTSLRPSSRFEQRSRGSSSPSKPRTLTCTSTRARKVCSSRVFSRVRAPSCCHHAYRNMGSTRIGSRDRSIARSRARVEIIKLADADIIQEVLQRYPPDDGFKFVYVQCMRSGYSTDQSIDCVCGRLRVGSLILETRSKINNNNNNNKRNEWDSKAYSFASLVDRSIFVARDMIRLSLATL